MDGLRGKTALITGAGGGIGRTLVSTFVGHGCRVIACDQDAGALAGLKGIAGTATFDLLDPASIANAAAAIEQKFGAPDCLVNNAGWTRAETMDDVTDAVIEKELALTPDSTALLQNLGKLYADTEQFDKAIATYEKLISVNPDAVEFYGLLADAYKRSGNTAKELET